MDMDQGVRAERHSPDENLQGAEMVKNASPWGLKCQHLVGRKTTL